MDQHVILTSKKQNRDIMEELKPLRVKVFQQLLINEIDLRVNKDLCEGP